MKPVHDLDQRVASAFYGRFPELRPAQEAVIGPLIAGENVVLTSGTGSGKTEAVMAPLLSLYWRRALAEDMLAILYVAPTKALVNDLERRLSQPLASLGLRVGVRHSDRDDLRLGDRPHVLVTTPESLDVLLFRREKSLSSVHAVILDEVHLLYNTQRGLQLSILLRRLQDRLSARFQWAALSATLGCLSNVRDFLFGPAEPARFVQFPADREIDAQVHYIARASEFLCLVRRLTEGQSIKLLIFANTRKECERLAGVLSQDPSLRALVLAHYSSLSHEVRVEAEQRFAEADTAICIATSTLELGIDIGDIDAVLLWGAPCNVESFLQRIGRGCRRTRKTNVVCLVPDDSRRPLADTLQYLALIDAAKKAELPIRSPYELFGAVAQQCLSVIGSTGGRFTRVAELCSLVNHHEYLERSIVERILAELADKEYLQHHGFKNQYGADDGLHLLVDYRMVYSNFEAASQDVEIRHGAKLLGAVPAINLIRLQRGCYVRFAGRRWKVHRVSPNYVGLEPSQSRGTALDFIYPGGGFRLDSSLANRMWSILWSTEFPERLLAGPLRAQVMEIRTQLGAVRGNLDIPFVRTPAGFRYGTFAGYLANKAVALILDYDEYHADDLTLSVPTPIDWRNVPTEPAGYERIFHCLCEASSNQSVFQTLLPTDLQLREFLQVWLRDEAVTVVLNRLASARPAEVAPNTLPFL